MLDTQRKRVDSLQILLIEDNPGDARLFEEHLREITEKPELQWERDLAAGISALDGGAFDVVALDLGLPDSEGTSTVERIRTVAPELPIVVLTGQESENLALSMLEVGATEYIRKSELAPSLLVRTLRWAVERKSMERKITERERRARSVLDALAANVAVLDREGTIVDVNQKWKQFARENDGDLDAIGVGANYLTACAPSEEAGSSAIPAVREEIRAVAAGEKELFEYQYPCHGPDEERWFLLRATPLDGAEGGAVVAHINVTERVQAVQEQRVLSAAIEQAQNAVLITGAETIGEPGPEIVYANSAVEDMTGYAEEELLGRTPRILQGSETERAVLESLREALEAGDEWTGETVNYRKDGTPYQVQWSVAPVRGTGGEIEYWVSVQRDVTDLRKREERLQLLAEALEQVGDKVVITDPEGQIQYVNKAFEEITGYSEEEALGKTPRIVQSGEQSEDFYEELWGTLRSGGTFRSELVNEKKDGTQYVEEEIITPVTDVDGKVTHFVSTGRDITERKRGEQELREKERQLEQIRENVKDVVWISTPRKNAMEFISDAYEEVWGRTTEELKEEPTSFIEGIHPDDRERVRSAMEVQRRLPEAYEEIYRVLQPSGEVRWVHDRAAGAYGEDGRLERVVGVATDITEKKRRERQLVEAKEEAERANRLKSAFLANMSHEIRTPLTSILGFAEAIGGEVESLQKASEMDLSTLVEFSSLIERSGRRLMDTLTSVLNLSKLQAGEMNLDLGPVDLATEAQEAAEEFGPHAKKAGIDLQTEVGGDPVWARADEGGLQIALRNLLSNAIKYTDEGKEVRVRVRQGANMAAVEVEDTGIGMDPETAQGLFEAFKQASEGMGRKYEGTGLGLAVTKEVLDRMGCSIEVETEKGRGSRFTVRLPRAEDVGPEDPGEA